MKLEQSFEVTAPLERVWEALIDVERVAPCLPGAAVTGRNEDGSYNGTFRVKIGPTSAAYTGKLEMEQIDESVHTATMLAQGTDRRGQGGAKATIVSTLAAAGDAATRVDVSTDYHITGRLARFGRGGMIEDISNKLLREFAKCLQSSLADPGVASVEAAEPAAPAVEPAAPFVNPAEPVVEPGEPAAPFVNPASPVTQPEAAVTLPAAPVTEPAPPLTPPAPPLSQPAPPLTPPAPPLSQPAPESEPVQGLSLMGSALWSQAKRKPVATSALVLGFLLAVRVLRRRG